LAVWTTVDKKLDKPVRPLDADKLPRRLHKHPIKTHNEGRGYPRLDKKVDVFTLLATSYQKKKRFMICGGTWTVAAISWQPLSLQDIIITRYNRASTLTSLVLTRQILIRVK
jgi:hypothetical protein